MLRFAAFAIACFFAVIVLLATVTTSAPPAQACSIGPRMFEDAVKRSSLVVLGDMISVGGAANSQPPLLRPSATPSLTPTAGTPPTTRTHTATGTPATPTATDSPFPTATPADLAGISAVVDVMRVYVGETASPLAIDALLRDAIERAIRRAELTPYPPPCEPGLGMYRFSIGARYLLLLRDDPDYGVVTTLRFRIEGDDAIVRDAAFGPDGGSLDMIGDTYRRFFAGTEAQMDHNETQDFAYVTAPRVPLSALTHAISSLHNGVTVTPPDTGSAGLASGRW